MDRRKFLLGTIGVAVAAPVLATDRFCKVAVDSEVEFVTNPDWDWANGFIDGIKAEKKNIVEGTKWGLAPTMDNSRYWVMAGDTSEFLQQGYVFVHDDDNYGMRVRKLISTKPNRHISAYLMKKLRYSIHG